MIKLFHEKNVECRKREYLRLVNAVAIYWELVSLVARESRNRRQSDLVGLDWEDEVQYLLKLKPLL